MSARCLGFVGYRAPRSATSPLLWLLGPVERELFASGGRLALGNGPGMGPDYGALKLYRDLINAIERIYNALSRAKTDTFTFCILQDCNTSCVQL